MKHTAVALTLTTFLLAGTPVLAKPKPSAPPTYLPSVVMPYDAYAPIFVVPMPEPRKNAAVLIRGVDLVMMLRFANSAIVFAITSKSRARLPVVISSFMPRV